MITIQQLAMCMITLSTQVHRSTHNIQVGVQPPAPHPSVSGQVSSSQGAAHHSPPAALGQVCGVQTDLVYGGGQPKGAGVGAQVRGEIGLPQVSLPGGMWRRTGVVSMVYGLSPPRGAHWLLYCMYQDQLRNYSPSYLVI